MDYKITRNYVIDHWLPNHYQLLDSLLSPSQEGKMFGVLLGHWQTNDRLPHDVSWVNHHEKKVILKAYSGQLNGIWNQPTWVPSLLDHPTIAGESWRIQKYLHSFTRKIKRLQFNGDNSLIDIDAVKLLKKQRAELSRHHAITIRDNTHLYSCNGQHSTLSSYWATAGTGVGECCAPKLISRAGQLKVQVQGFVEFWWGAPPKRAVKELLETKLCLLPKEGKMIETRVSFYGPCQARCQPLMPFLLDTL